MAANAVAAVNERRDESCSGVCIRAGYGAVASTRNPPKVQIARGFRRHAARERPSSPFLAEIGDSELKSPQRLDDPAADGILSVPHPIPL
jgi:hypothetical protein